MLAQLQIADFAIITRLDLALHPKFNAFTGETGAGKSIIIDALGVVLGGRASPDLVRTGSSAARVQALFQLDPETASRLAPRLSELGIEPADDVILSREIAANGRSTARVNGTLVPVATLREIAEGMVDITGQSEHLSLLRPSAQLDMLDQYARSGELRAAVAQLYREARRLEEEIAGLVRDRQEAERRADMLRFQLEEIDTVAPQPGEDEELSSRRTLLANAEKLRTLADTAYQALYGETGSALDKLRIAESAMSDLVRYDPNLGPDLEILREALVNVEEGSLSVRRYRDSVEYDPGALQEIEDRLDALTRLKRKYGATVDEVLAYGRTAAEELDGLEHSEERAEELRRKLDAVRADLGRQAGELSAVRRAAATELGGRIEQALADLLMARARVEVQVAPKPPEGGAVIEVDGESVGVDGTGMDRVEIMLAPNPGEPMKPMARIASGGEISRIMLAVRSVLSDADSTPTLVFDEVDVGVGGRSGAVVGEKLYGLTRTHQVLTITHLAQVAAYADAHFRIAKLVDDGRTSTAVTLLEPEDTRAEVAAMLGGLPVSPRTLESADELLGRAAEWKSSMPAPLPASPNGHAPQAAPSPDSVIPGAATTEAPDGAPNGAVASPVSPAPDLAADLLAPPPTTPRAKKNGRITPASAPIPDGEAEQPPLIAKPIAKPVRKKKARV